MTFVQVVRLKDVMLLGERLGLAVRTTRAFSFYFLVMSLILVVISTSILWLEACLWVIAIFGAILHGLMVFGNPEKWQAFATLFFFSALTLTSLVALIGTFQ